MLTGILWINTDIPIQLKCNQLWVSCWKERKGKEMKWNKQAKVLLANRNTFPLLFRLSNECLAWLAGGPWVLAVWLACLLLRLTQDSLNQPGSRASSRASSQASSQAASQAASAKLAHVNHRWLRVIKEKSRDSEGWI